MPMKNSAVWPSAINDELAMLGFKTGSEEERLAIENLRRSYHGLLSFAQDVFEDPRTNRTTMPWLEEKIESQLFPELERRVEMLRVYYRDEAAVAVQRTRSVQQLTHGLAVMIVLLSLIQGGILLFGIQRWLVQAAGRDRPFDGDHQHRQFRAPGSPAVP